MKLLNKYLITVEFNSTNKLHGIRSTFTIGAVKITLGQAKKIAKVLYPYPVYKSVKIVDCIEI